MSESTVTTPGNAVGEFLGGESLSGTVLTTAQEQIKNLNSGQLSIFSTIKADNQAAKLALYDAVTDAYPVAEFLDQTINLIHVAAQVVKVKQDDGSMVECVRTILLDENGTAYAAVSNGLFSAVQDFLGVVGMPESWEAGAIPVRVVSMMSRSRFRFYTLKLAEVDKATAKAATKAPKPA